MASESRHIIVAIDCPAVDVYHYVSSPENLPSWASGLGDSVENVDGTWLIHSPLGTITVSFVGSNVLGVLDHHVTLSTGETVYNPMRVIPDGSGCEVVFTLRRRPGQSYEQFCADVALVEADLATLRRALETTG